MICIVIDDERHAANLLADYIRQTPGLELAGIFTNPLTALELFSGTGPAPDLTLLDIDMPELSGMDLAGLISHKTRVVFTTSFREYAPEAFEKDAADYLLKPVGYERFLRCIQRIRARDVSQAAITVEYFFVKSDIKGKMVRVSIPEIRYIESNGNYVQIYLAKEKIIAYLTLSEIMAQLPPGRFSRIHRSIVVAQGYIRSVEHFQVKLLDRAELLPIGRTYSAHFLKELQAALLISKREH
jgi:DNA-binding LytR/AlgR family response regulator